MLPGARFKKSLAQLLSLLFLMGAVGSAGCRKRTASPRIEARFQLGIRDAVVGHRWNLLSLKVRNLGADFRGTVTVEGLVFSGQKLRKEPVAYRREMEIPGESATYREISFPVRPEEWEKFDVTFRQPGYGEAIRVEVPQKDVLPKLRLLVIADDIPNLSGLTKFIQSDLETTETDNFPPLELGVTMLSSRKLPALAPAYDPFGIVLLHGSSLAEAPAEAIGALEHWVRRGGTLVAFPGPAWAGGVPGELWQLLGVSPGNAEAGMPPELLDLLGENVGRSYYYRELTAAPGSERTARGGAFRSLPGAGAVTTFSFSPGAPFPARVEAEELYKILRYPLARSVSFGGGSGSGLRQIEAAVARDLFALSGFQIPERTLVFLGLTLYLVVGFFLPAYIFKRLGRREWTFLAVLLAAVLGTVAIYRFGLLSAREVMEIDEVSVLRLHPGSQTAAATSYLGIISPSLARFELEETIGPQGAWPQPLRGGVQRYPGDPSRIPVANTTLEVQAEGKLRLGPATLYPNAMHYLRYDYEVSGEAMEEILEVKSAPSAAGYPRIVNRGSVPLELYVTEDDRYSMSLPLRPGEERELSEPLGASPYEDIPGLKNPTRRYSFTGSDPSSIPRSVRNKVLRAVARPHLNFTLQNYGPDVDLPANPWRAEEPRYLIALTQSPVFPAVPSIPVRNAVTAVVVELPPRNVE